jgi:hypothetical protein
VPKGKGKIFAIIILAVRKYPSAEGTLTFSNRQYYFPEKTEVFPAKKLGQFSAQRAPLGFVPAKKLGQFSALFKFREASPSVGPPIYLSANIFELYGIRK